MNDADRSDRWEQVRGRGLDGELRVVLDVWSEVGRAPSTTERLTGLITRFVARLAATGVTSLLAVTLADCEGFVWARTRRNATPALHTVHLRRTALGGLFAVLRQLEPGFVDPTVDLTLPSKTQRRVRPLTDAEMTSVRVTALGRVRSTNRAVLAVALAEATATTGEIPQVRWCDVDLAAHSVHLLGASPVAPREGPLSAWGQRVMERVQRDEDPHANDFVVARRGHYATPHDAQAAMANLLTKVLTAAGVTGSGVRPTSIRLWGARQVLLASGIEAAAAALGVASLDVARRALSNDAEGR